MFLFCGYMNGNELVFCSQLFMWQVVSLRGRLVLKQRQRVQSRLRIIKGSDMSEQHRHRCSQKWVRAPSQNTDGISQAKEMKTYSRRSGPEHPAARRKTTKKLLAKVRPMMTCLVSQVAIYSQFCLDPYKGIKKSSKSKANFSDSFNSYKNNMFLKRKVCHMSV